MWQSPDPILADYMRGERSGEGVYTPPNLNLYGYVQQRPIGATDPDGKACIASYFSNYCRRSRLYRSYDSIVSSETRFYGAASLTTNMLGSMSGVGEGAASLIGLGVSGDTENRMKEISARLESINTEQFGRIRSGQESLSGVALDRKMVALEQTEVQAYLDEVRTNDIEAYDAFVSEVNQTLTPSSGERFAIGLFSSWDQRYLEILDDVQADLGRSVDFANQADREAIGNALASDVRARGLRD